MRLRVCLIAIILIPINSLWLMTASLWNAGYPTTVSLFFNAVFYHFVLVLINALVRRTSPRHALSAAEMLAVYVMLTVASALNGLDMLQLLGSMVVGPYALATPENDWRQLFIKHLPPWLILPDGAALEAYIQGDSSLYLARNLNAWVTPALSWGSFTICLVLVMLGVTLILSSRWVSEERLSYPIIQLPLHLVQPGFLRNRKMWLGFGIGAAMGLINGLHFFFPTVPTLGKPVNIGQYFTEKPLNAIGWLPIAVQPFAVGLSFFMPLELSFSCWFFYFAWKFQKVLASIFGLQRHGFPFIDEQTTGAYIGFALAALWMARKHLTRIFRGRDPTAKSRADTAHYPLAIGALVLGSVGIVGICLRAGMGLRAICLFFGGYFLISIAIGRIRAELGSPVHDLHFSGPGRMMVSIFGARRFSPVDLTVISQFWYFNRAYRSHPMPAIVEGVKLGEQSNLSAMWMGAYVLVAIFFGTLCGLWAPLHAAYTHGAGAKLWPANETFSRLSSWLTAPTGGEVSYTLAFGFGGLSVFALTFLRTRFIWFPLHPVGMVVSSSWSMNPFWFSIFLGWVFKAALLQYSGLGRYRELRPVFLGLILGEFVADSGVSIAGTIFKVPTYIWYG